MNRKKTDNHRHKKNVTEAPIPGNSKIADSNPDAAHGKISSFLTVRNISTVAFVIFAYIMLVVCNGYMLRWYEEMSLFESGKIFFSEFFNYPGGLLRYVGAWLTQFMYYPALGSTILIALWLLMAWMSCKAFHLSENAVPLSLIIPLAMLVSILQLDEAWLTLKTPGYIFSNTLGFLFAIALIWLFKISECRKALSLFFPALITQTYFILGFYGLAAAMVCLIILLIRGVSDKDYKCFIAIAATIFLMLETPSLYFKYWHGNLVDNDYLLLKGLPELLFESFDIYLWIPFVVAANWLGVLGIIGSVKPESESRLTSWISVTLFVLALAWCVRADHKSSHLRASVKMMGYVDRHDWRSVNGVMDNFDDQPNYTMLAINNLANAEQGKPTVNLSRFTPRPADRRHDENFTMSVFIQVPVFYYIGKNSESYRMAMEHTIAYGKRVFFLKYMVKNALVNGEVELARRYNDILLGTMFHRRWAEEMKRFIDNPGLIDKNPEFNSVRTFLQ